MDEKWAVFGSEDTTAIWVEDESGKRVCTLRNCETDLDRANLIAAAPETAADRDRLQAINAELVAALDFVLAHAPYWIANNKNGEKEMDRVVIQTARAALSKAKES